MRFQVLLILLFSGVSTLAQNDYYFPSGATFDKRIQSPEQFLGRPVGEFHTRHDQIVSYMKYLAEASDHAVLQTIGYTAEKREQVWLFISKKETLNNLEEVRKSHLELADPSSSANITAEMPVITLLGYGVHGNEPSSSEAAMLTAYYLLASEDSETSRFLDNSLIIIDPCYNPDGRDRHTQWVNAHKAFPPIADPIDREHNEAWPGGRTNHYWFDLNRDWLPLTHVESRNRIEWYQQWLPNVATDFHEMGTNSTYFFEPTEPYGSENPVVPRSNYQGLNELFANYYQQSLDEIGSLYFTGEVFDNSYPGYGSTYPDIHGGLGLVFEQASSRGHIQRSSTLDVTFPFTIRNHTRTSIATVRAASENRRTLLQHQKEFYESALEEAAKSSVKGYVFTAADKHLSTRFVDLLLQHDIDTYLMSESAEVGGQEYPAGSSYFVPTEQPQYRMVRSMFEKVTDFHDSVFYDASTWTMALAYGLQYSEVANQKVKSGEKLNDSSGLVERKTFTESRYAYLIEWNQYPAARALNLLLRRGINVKTAFKPFQIEKDQRSFGYGTLMISVQDQLMGSSELFEAVQAISDKLNLEVVSVSTGRTLAGIDLGSNSFRTVSLPKVLLVVGEGVSSYEAGELWFLSEKELELPITKVDILDFGRVRLSDYTHLVLVSGSYQYLTSHVPKIERWISDGGVVWSQRSAVSWMISNSLVNEQLDTTQVGSEEGRVDYDQWGELRGSKQIGGSIYQTDVDISHPLAFGYRKRTVPVYRNHRIFLLPSGSSTANVIQYTSEPHLAGYIHRDNLEKLSGTTSMIATRMGRGGVVLMTDNVSFRGYWFGTNRFFFNTLFFGNLY